MLHVAGEMPKYKCHKVVSALKIASIVEMDINQAREPVGAVITPKEKGYACFNVSGAYLSKHNPQVGGYYVVCEDGYESFSPVDAFESGHKRI
jgi:hypothetical protein